MYPLQVALPRPGTTCRVNEAKREFQVNFNDETLPFCSEPKCLGVTLDRTLTYRRHFAKT